MVKCGAQRSSQRFGRRPRWVDCGIAVAVIGLWGLIGLAGMAYGQSDGGGTSPNQLCNNPPTPTPISPDDDETGVSVQLTLEINVNPLALEFSFCDWDETQWQIATDADFDDLVYQTNDGADPSTLQVPDGRLNGLTTYYWRARIRHESSVFLGGDRVSSWSAVRSFQTSLLVRLVCNWPVISHTAPEDDATGVGLSPTLRVSKGRFTLAPVCSHDATQWQIARDEAFADVIHDSGDDADHLTSLPVPSGTLLFNGTYYWRVRFKSDDGDVSSWSEATSFRTAELRLVCNWPTLRVAAPADGADDLSLTPTLRISKGRFTLAPACSHDLTQWQVATDADFTNVVYDSGDDPDHLTSVMVPAGRLAYAQSYYVRARLKSDAGDASDWSTEVRFTTLAESPPPGGEPPEPPAAGGLSDYDNNGNCRLDDGEFLQLIDDWINAAVANDVFFDGIDAWIAQSNVCLGGSMTESGALLQLDNGEAAIDFIATQRTAASMAVTVYDLDGRAVFTERTATGRLSWGLTTSDGRPVANGVYLYSILIQGSDGTVRRHLDRLMVLR